MGPMLSTSRSPANSSQAKAFRHSNFSFEKSFVQKVIATAATAMAIGCNSLPRFPNEMHFAAWRLSEGASPRLASGAGSCGSGSQVAVASWGRGRWIDDRYRAVVPQFLQFLSKECYPQTLAQIGVGSFQKHDLQLFFLGRNSTYLHFFGASPVPAFPSLSSAIFGFHLSSVLPLPFLPSHDLSRRHTPFFPCSY